MREFATTKVAIASMAMTLGVMVGAAPLPQSGGAAGKPKPLGACSLLPKAEVKKVAAVNDQFFDMVPPREEPLPGGGSACSYSGIHIQLDPFTPGRLEELRKEKGTQWTAIADVGDAAYFYDNNRSTTARYAELYARVGPRVVTIQMSVRPSTASAETVRPAAVALAKALVARLR